MYIRNLGTGEDSILDVLGENIEVEGDWLAYSRSEGFEGEDLNGDGDTEDDVVYVRNLATDETSSGLGLALTDSPIRLSSGRMAFRASESQQGADLNGDGDGEDHFVHVRNLGTSEATNIINNEGRSFLLRDDRLVLQTNRLEGQVLNLDTDESTDFAFLGVPVSWALSGEWLFYLGRRPGGPAVAYLHNFATGVTTSLEIAGDSPGTQFSEGWLVFPASESSQEEDLNGDGDTTDLIAQLVDLRPVPFRRGEVNADGNLDISDGVFTLSWLFVGGASPVCLDAADTDDSGAVDLTDAIGVFNFLFLGGEPPPAPGPQACGADETEDSLGCASFPACM